MTRGRETAEQAYLRRCLTAAEESQDHADNMRQRLQARIIGQLIRKFGGVRKAAAAVDQSPGNFANLNTGGRLAKLDLLKRLAKPLLE